MSSDIANNDGMLFTPNYMHRGIDGIGVDYPAKGSEAEKKYQADLHKRMFSYMKIFPVDQKEYNRVTSRIPGCRLAIRGAFTSNTPKALLDEMVGYLAFGAPGPKQTYFYEKVNITGMVKGEGSTPYWVVYGKPVVTAPPAASKKATSTYTSTADSSSTSETSGKLCAGTILVIGMLLTIIATLMVV
jgi:hypothetical protein